MKEKDIEEIQQEFFGILGNMKLLKNKGKNEQLYAYIDENYEILKNELSDDWESDK